MADGDRALTNMVFDIFTKIVSTCPKIANAATKLLDFYADYPRLL
jgi:hypothetical protein